MEWIQDIWGTGSDNVWAVGVNGTLLHYDGTVWVDSSRTFTSAGRALSASGAFLHGVWGTGPNDIWIVGSGNLAAGNTLVEIIYHFNGTSWTDATTGFLNSALTNVWGTGPADVWASGSSGTIIHYNGTSWTDLTFENVNHSLEAVWGTRTGDLWAIGEAGTILRAIP